MRTRLVTWGTNGQDEKVLIGVSLNADENKIDLIAIPAKDCSEDFYNQMMNQWREGADLELPSGTEKRSLELTMSDSILPEDYRVERTDVIQRAQMEWHFLVLSTKLYRNFKSELEDMASKVKGLEAYDKTVWDDLKTLWDTIQKHTFDRNILRDHADSLREKSNALFEELKKLRSSVEKELVSKSTALMELFNSKMEEIHNRINTGGVLKIIFDDLKKIQEEFKSQTMLREDKNKVFKKLDEAFNAVREKRTGSPNKPISNGEKGNPALSRFESRLTGLDQALNKIQKSIEFDQKDIEFENKRIASSTGQLEAQIRVAKIKMIEDRMKSKKEKLEELLKIKSTLVKSTESIKKKEEKREKKQEEKEHRKVEEQKVKAKYDDEVQHKPALEPELEDKLVKAAEEIKEGKKPRIKKSNISDFNKVETTSSSEDIPEEIVNEMVEESITSSTEEIPTEIVKDSQNSAVSDSNDNQPDSASDSSEIKTS